MKAHNFLAFTSIAPIILPSEGDMNVIDSNDAAVGDSDKMSLSAKIS